MDWRARIEQETPHIQEVLSYLRQRHRLGSEDWEDFRSWVWVRLAESDYAVLRKFEGRSPLTLYLQVVLQRWFVDFQRSKWGHWRPSVVAHALGPDAVLLEHYIHREGFSRDEAIQMVETNHKSPCPRAELLGLASRLPEREARPETTSLSSIWLDRLESENASPEEELSEQESEVLRERALSTLGMIVGRLSTEERVILRMRFEQGLRVNEIARAVGRKPAEFYRQFKRLRRRIRTLLEKSGIDTELLGVAFPDVGWRS